MKFSVIIPTFNDIELGYLERNLESLCSISNLEIICVDGGSADGTIELIQSFDVHLIELETNSRAIRLNEGAKIAKGEYLFLHHPRSFVDPAFFTKESTLTSLWGGLTHRFDNKKNSFLLSFTSWYSNSIRLKYKSIIYLDHCFFVKRELFLNIGGIPEVDIFEDTLLSLKLREHAKAVRLPYISETSDIRFSKNGAWKQALMNQKLKLQFYLNQDHLKMNKAYEEGLELNSNYRSKK